MLTEFRCTFSARLGAGPGSPVFRPHRRLEERSRLMSETAKNAVTPEAVAFRLMEKIMTAERKSFLPSPTESGATTITRDEVLDLYALCIDAVSGNRHNRLHNRLT
jgi:hypothetical protein